VERNMFGSIVTIAVLTAAGFYAGKKFNQNVVLVITTLVAFFLLKPEYLLYDFNLLDLIFSVFLALLPAIAIKLISGGKLTDFNLGDSQQRDNSDGVGSATFLIGKILSANDTSYTTTSVGISKDVFGNDKATAYNTLHSSHRTWIYDYQREKEVEYRSSGESPGRPGHSIGVAMIEGQGKLEVNFDTNIEYTYKSISEHIGVAAGLLSVGMLFLGWVMIPVSFLKLLYSRLAKKPLCFYTNTSCTGFPGSEAPQIKSLLIQTVLVGAIYLLLLASLMKHSTDLAFVAVGVFVGLIWCNVHFLKATTKAYHQFISKCRNELSLRYKNHLQKVSDLEQANSKASLENLTVS
jgi:hypothetical protein